MSGRIASRLCLVLGVATTTLFVAGCPSPGGQSPDEPTPVATSPSNGIIEIGLPDYSGLSVLGIHDEVSVAVTNLGQFTAQTSTEGIQLLTATDGTGLQRGLVMALPISERGNDLIRINPASTVVAMLASAPGVAARPSESNREFLKRLAQIPETIAVRDWLNLHQSSEGLEQIASNSEFLNLYRTALEAATSSSRVPAGRGVFPDVGQSLDIGGLMVRCEPPTENTATSFVAPLTIRNTTFRPAKVFGVKYDFADREIGTPTDLTSIPWTSYGVLEGAKPVSIGDLLTFLFGGLGYASTPLPNQTLRLGSAIGGKKFSLWVFGPGLADCFTSPPPGQAVPDSVKAIADSQRGILLLGVAFRCTDFLLARIIGPLEHASLGATTVAEVARLERDAVTFLKENSRVITALAEVSARLASRDTLGAFQALVTLVRTVLTERLQAFISNNIGIQLGDRIITVTEAQKALSELMKLPNLLFSVGNLTTLLYDLLFQPTYSHVTYDWSPATGGVGTVIR